MSNHFLRIQRHGRQGNGICQSFIAATLMVTLGAGCSTFSSTSRQSEEDAPATAATEMQAQAEAAEQIKRDQKTEIAPATLYQLLVAEIAMQRGQLGVAVANYIEAAKLTHDPETAARAAQIARYAQDYAQAKLASEIWVKSAPNDPEARLVYASIFMLSSEPGPAVVQYKKLIELSKDEPGKGFTTIANQLARIPDRMIAMTVMEQIIESYQDEPSALFSYAHLAMRQAKFDIAVSSLDKVLSMKPDWANAVILKARVLALQKGRDDSLKYLANELQGSMSENISVGVTYAKMLVEAKQYEKAMEQFVHLTELAPNNMDIFFPSGVLALQQGKLDLAKELLSKVVKSGKRYYEANYYLGQVYEQSKQTTEAIDRYELVRRGDLYFSAQVRVVSLWSRMKEFSKAKSHLQSIRVRNDKQGLQIILLEGDLLREQGFYPEAKKFYSGMLDNMPNETSLRYARALVAEKLGEIDLVESDLQAILEVEPANAQVLNALGYTLADKTTRYEEALGYIKKAMDMEPNDAAIMDSMGWVLYRMGKYQDAIGHLRRANDMAKDPEIAAHLGEVLWESGNKDAAKTVWNDSLKGHPEHEILREVMKRFGL